MTSNKEWQKCYLPPCRLWEVLPRVLQRVVAPGHETAWPASELRRAWKAEVVPC